MARSKKADRTTPTPAKGGGTATKKGKKPGSPGGRAAWKVLDRTSSVAAGLLAKEVSTVAWRTATGKKPPTTGRHPDVDAREAVAWAVVGGALAELVKIGVRRYAATYWVRSTGDLPPGMKSLSAPPLVDDATVVPEPSGSTTRKARRRAKRR